MSEPLPEVVLATSRLRAAIEDAAAALAGADLERLLASDARLQNALHDISAPDTLAPQARTALGAEVDAALSALRRCRRLGATLSAFTRFSLEAQGREVGYGRGRLDTPILTGREFNQKV